MNQFRPDSVNVLSTISMTDRKQQGIFFTPSSIRRILIEHVINTCSSPIRTILEPAMGSGEFVYDIYKTFPHANITGIELNTSIYKHNESPVTRKYNCDFLSFESDVFYDLIIGNPPYFQITDPEEKKKYRSIYPQLEGKFDIYLLFILKAVQLLSSNKGVLAFVLPKTFMNTQSYDKVRRFLVERYSLLNIIDFGMYDNDWNGTKQSTIGLILQEKPPDVEMCTPFGMEICPTLFLINTRKSIDILKSLSSNRATIHSKGYKVKTGEIVCTHSKYKASLSDTPGYLLIHNSQLRNNAYIPEKPQNSNRPLYIHCDPKYIIQTPVIVLNRGNGNSGFLKFQFALIDPSKFEIPLVAENHVYKIFGPDIMSLYKSLNDPRTKIFVKHTVGNGSLTKTFIESIPFFDTQS